MQVRGVRRWLCDYMFNRSSRGTYRSGDDEVGLRVEVAAEDIVGMTSQRLQTLTLRRQ